ncbi:MAG: peptide deformylase [bacterium]|jgi:peptide deformylase
MSFEIVTFGDPILRVVAEPIARVTVEYKRLVDGMMETMHMAEGVGLAAQQVGRAVSVCVVDIPVELDVEEEGGGRLNPEVEMPLVMFNPKIMDRGGELERRDEGCLSFPGIHTGVQRAAEVDVTFVDWKGVVRNLHCRGLLARAVQHELDHLAGVLLVDRMSPVKKISLAGKLKRLRAETAERMQGKKALAQATSRI